MSGEAKREVGEPLIEIKGLAKRYGDHEILHGVDLAVAAGETVALLGPSGSGKSTLLRCVNALTGWDRGRVRVAGHTVEAPGNETPKGEAVRQVRRLVGMVFQDFQLFPHLRVLANVTLGPVTVLGRPRRDAEETARDLLGRVGLANKADAWPDQLSGGQKQRVAIARALAMAPRALLCDEVTSALDPELKHEVLEVLEDLKRQGQTLLLVTHEIGFARRAADRVVVLADGAILESGSPAEVLDRPQHPRTQQFLRRVLA